MKAEGYLYLYRRIEDSWQWQRPLWRSAWIWMMVKARFKDGDGLKRGQLYGSIQMFTKAWGMTRREVRYFLRKAISERDILIDRGRGGHFSCCAFGIAEGTACGTPNGTACGIALSVVTLVNYDTYQPFLPTNGTACGTPDGTACGIATDTLLEEMYLEEKYKEEKNNTLPVSGKRAVRKRASHDKDFLLQEISKINITDFIREFESQGLDVTQCFDEWTEYVLDGSAKDPRPNPSNWTDFSKAFKNRCRFCLDKRKHLTYKKSESLDEKLKRIAKEQGFGPED